MTQKRKPPRRTPKPAAPTSWDPLASWYDGWVGEGGSEHHRRIAVPAVMEMLQPRPGERVLDVGCGQGVLAPAVHRAGAIFTGVDASPRLIALARKRHRADGTFLVGDARRLRSLPEIGAGAANAVVFLLSLQDMDPLEEVLASASWALETGGRIVILLTHPAFRVPRQSGWGWDEGRKLLYRRIDRYLTHLPVPLKAFSSKEGAGVTRSFHRPISAYVNRLSEAGMLTDHVLEVPGPTLAVDVSHPRAARTAREEIPLFLGLRAIKIARQVVPK